MHASRAQGLARIASVLILLSIAAGGFAEVYVPGKLLAAFDPAAGTANIAQYAQLLRGSFVVYLIEAVCDISLAMIFYLLLRPVSYPLSLLAAFFGLVSTATFATAEFFYFVSSLPLLDANVQRHLGAEQRALFVYLSLTLYGYGGTIFMAFYGIATGLRGFLICRAAYLPAWIGVLLILAGAGFIAKNLLFVLAPQFDSGFLLAPMFAATIALAGWLAIKGIDAGKWPEGPQA
jgi:hypothetical protein